MNQAASDTDLLRVWKAADEWDTLGIMASLRLHWPEYLMEAGEMSLYLFFACCFATLFATPRVTRLGILLSTASSAGR